MSTSLVETTTHNNSQNISNNISTSLSTSNTSKLKVISLI